MSPLIVIK